MKKLFLVFICLCIGIAADAQSYKVLSVDKQSSENMKLLQVLEVQDRVLVYGTITSAFEKNWASAGRMTAIVKNGMRYKLTNAVNLPFFDEAEPRYLVLRNGESANFVLEFEKFDLSGSFDLLFIEGSKDPDKYDFYGIKLEKISEKDVIDTKRFLDEVHTIYGKYVVNGKEHNYYIRDNVMFEFGNSWFGNDFLFEVKIVNNSDHGVMVDMNNIHASATDKKDRPKEVVRYTADSYDAYVERDRQMAAYQRTGASETADQNSSMKRKIEETNNAWTKIGLSALIALNNKAQDNRVHNYLKKHPRTLPKGLRTTSLKAGESVSGYIPYKKIKSVKMFYIDITLDGYKYEIKYQIN